MALTDLIATRNAALAARNTHPQWAEFEGLIAQRRALRGTVTEATPQGSAEYQQLSAEADALRASIEDEVGYTAAAHELRAGYRDTRVAAAGLEPAALEALPDAALRAQIATAERQRMSQRGSAREATEALRAALLAEARRRGVTAARVTAREIRGER